MNIIILIPYFGRLPEYFDVFLKSVVHLSHIDFRIFTDDRSALERSYSKNVCVQIMSFSEIQQRIHKIWGVKLTSGYKLCDFKPMYAELFSDFIKGYDYWGYCDIDTMMGDVMAFLNNIDYTHYDRIGKNGHFTLYRNCEYINALYKKYPKTASPNCNYLYVISTTYPCNFDEVGMNEIVKSQNILFYEENHVADTTIMRDLHLHTYGNSKTPELFVYINGKCYVYSMKDNIVCRKEYMYIHFQDRKNMPVNGNLSDKVLITHLGFFPFDESHIQEYFSSYGAVDTKLERTLYMIGKRKGQMMRRLKRLIIEISEYGWQQAWYTLRNRL